MADSEKFIPLEDGPWTGLLDAPVPTSKQAGKYFLGQNVYPGTPATNGVIGRGGTRRLGGFIGVGTADNSVYTIFQWTDGTTETTIALCHGGIWVLDWTTEVWTSMVTAAEIVTAGVTGYGTGLGSKQTCVPAKNHQLLISTGDSMLFLWDGTAGAGSITPITNCPVSLYGPPTVYEGHLFGIKAVDPEVMIWSEADDFTTGYEAGGFSNAWRFTQTDRNPLKLLVGTNASLLVLRAPSTTLASGGVSSGFESTATREGVDASTGTGSPFAAMFVNSSLLILDAQWRPHILRPGASQFTPIWEPFQELLSAAEPDDFRSYFNCAGVVHDAASLAFFAIPDGPAPTPNTLLVYDISGPTPVAVAVWRGFGSLYDSYIYSLAIVKQPQLYGGYRTRLVHGTGTGRVLLHAEPDEMLEGGWALNDVDATNTQIPIDHILETQALGYGVKGEKVFDRLDIATACPTAQTLELLLTTPAGASTAQTVTAAASDADAHVDCGCDSRGRWARVQIRHRTVDEAFGIAALSLSAYAASDDPELP